jgi:hypothetical protein
VTPWASTAATRVGQELVSGGGCTTAGPFASQHGGKLCDSLFIGEALHLGQGATIHLALRDAQMDICLRRYLRQVRDTENLMLRRDAAQAPAESLPCPPSESGINFIKDKGARLTCVAERLLDGE